MQGWTHVQYVHMINNPTLVLPPPPNMNGGGGGGSTSVSGIMIILCQTVTGG